MDVKMKKFLFMLTTLLAVSATEVTANEGLIIDVFGGANWLTVNKNKTKSRSNGVDSSLILTGKKAKFDAGYVFGGAVGYQWCNNFIADLEVSYRRNDLKRGSLLPRIDGDSSLFGNCNKNRSRGHFRSVALMANLYYDIEFDTCSCSNWNGYIGGGIGFSNQKLKINRRLDCLLLDGIPDSFNKPRKDKNDFAAQAIVGLGWKMNECITFDLEYRYMYIKDYNNNSLIVGAHSGF